MRTGQRCCFTAREHDFRECRIVIPSEARNPYGYHGSSWEQGFFASLGMTESRMYEISQERPDEASGAT
jgi:hypothetical protein